MTAVRPPIFPPSHGAQPVRADAGRVAAQKAFFDLALGKAAQPAPAAAAIVADAAPSTPTSRPRIPDPDAEKPQRILRPGSLLDIRV